MDNKAKLIDTAKLFLKIGFIGFIEPAAHIAMMQEKVVKKKWLSEQHFIDLMEATNLIPKPNSIKMAIHIGHEQGGWKGFTVAGFNFVLPAVFITKILAWLYKQYRQLSNIQPLVYGIKPAIIAIILGPIFPLAKKSFKSKELFLIGSLVLIGSLFGISELKLMLAAGILALVFVTFQNH